MNEPNRPPRNMLVVAGGVALVVVGGLALATLFGSGTPQPGPVSPAEGTGAEVEPPSPEDPAGQPPVIDRPSEPPSVEDLLERIQDLRGEPKVESNQGRLEAIRVLGELQSDRSRSALQEIVEDGSDRFERLTAMSVIWATGDRDYLIDLAAKSNDPVVQAKVKALQAAGAGR